MTMRNKVIIVISISAGIIITILIGLRLNYYTLSEENNNYAIHASYPKSSSRKVEKILRKFINEEISNFKKEFGSKQSPNWKNELNISYEKSGFSNNHESFLIFFYTFTGGAHGNTNIVTKNYDLKKVEEVKLDDVFDENSDYLEVISEIVMGDLEKKLIQIEIPPDSKKLIRDWIEEGAGPKKENYQNFTLTPNSIIFHFGQYQVASYADGIQRVKIPFSKISDVLISPFVKGKEYTEKPKEHANPKLIDKSCKWETFTSEKLGIELMVQKCNLGEMSPRFYELKDSIVQMPEKFINPSKDGFKIIEVYSKKENENIEEVIKEGFISKIKSRYKRKHCELRPSYFKLLDAKKICLEVEPDIELEEKIKSETPSNSIPEDACEGYGVSGSGTVRYFEHHPEESKRKFIFVRIGQDKPAFDEQSIKFISD